jgi:hypothetical protein
MEDDPEHHRRGTRAATQTLAHSILGGEDPSLKTSSSGTLCVSRVEPLRRWWTSAKYAIESYILRAPVQTFWRLFLLLDGTREVHFVVDGGGRLELLIQIL